MWVHTQEKQRMSVCARLMRSHKPMSTELNTEGVTMALHMHKCTYIHIHNGAQHQHVPARGVYVRACVMFDSMPT